MIESPCYECENRIFGCYHSCEAYKTWRERFDAIQRKRRDMKRTDDMMKTYIVEQNERWRRRRGR